MEERLIAHLTECLAALKAGERVESCLARYPEETDELAPLLQIALALESLPQPGPSVATARAAKIHFLAEVERRRQTVAQSLWSRIRQHLRVPTWPEPVRALATAALAVAMALLIGGSVISAASGSLPGDALYGLKLLGEDAQYALTFNRDSRIRLEEAFTVRRRGEVRQLLTRGRQEEVEFGGLLREWTENQWRIEDIPVVVSAGTRLQAEPSLNVFVEIHGRTQADGTVLALMVEIEGDEITGRVETIGPSRWWVNGQRILVDAKTYIQDGLQVGDCVEVHARRFASGTLLALEIERTEACQDDSTEDATPVETPRPTVSPTLTLPAGAAPTATSIGAPMPPPSVTPNPTRTPTLSATPTAVPAVPPSSTPELGDDGDDGEDTPIPTPVDDDVDGDDGDADDDGDATDDSDDHDSDDDNNDDDDDRTGDNGDDDDDDYDDDDDEDNSARG